MKMRCAIVDDEFLARQYLSVYVSKVPFLELVGDYNSPLKVSEQLHNGEIDLLFLDIQMPDITGLDFLRSLDRKPLVIITTAFKEYAYDSYEFDVVDYLLKPFSFERLLKAVHKAHDMFQKSSTPEQPLEPEQEEPNFHEDYLVIRADRKYYKINFDNLIYVEGQKAYVTFHSEGQKRVTALASLKELEEKLPSGQFIRIHKSYIVSISKIESLEGNLVEVAGQQLPVGKSYRHNVDKLFGLSD
ncbi:DNA-binding response regulator [Marinilabiliaceae bacterium JC017]|nr:DNA-binding response regulator [Marinilabiliaceae bacterium JC017]